jgi:hypothetical protein
VTLTDLYPAGTPMSEVHPDFRGMPLGQWKLLKIAEQCAAWHNRMSQAEREALPLPHNPKIHTPRDGYGK